MAKDLRRILYVEDEADIRTIAITVLEAIGGFTVIACSSGTQAIEAAPGADADLILLDVMMPGMDGPATLEALREIPQTAATPVVFMTAKVQAGEIAHFRSLGALDVIPKPFDPMTLPEQIAEIWRRRPQAVEQPMPQTLSADSTEDALQVLYRRYAADLPATIANIEGLWKGLVSGSESLALKALHRALHSLAGSGETFGYTQLGKSAQEMELALEPCLKSAAVPQAMIETLSSMLDRLKQAANAPDRPA
jgi:two-component system OmpR family response regulator